jgi:hypothetical protein
LYSKENAILKVSISCIVCFFSGFPSIGTFVDTRGGQRAQRDLHEKEAEVQQRQQRAGGKQTEYKFPDPEFGGFVPMRKNRRYN